jgi:hypothetical protein
MKKTEYHGIYKLQEGILLNVDKTGLEKYKLRKNKERKINSLEDDVHNLKNDISEIKTLLKALVEK